MKHLFTILIITLSFSICFSQSNKQDSTAKQKKEIKPLRKPHSVKNAVLFSAFLPGAGQIYNARAKRYYNQFKLKKDRQKIHWWWKVPIIYGGLGASAYFIYANDRQVKKYRAEYNYRIENNTTLDADLFQYDNSALLTIHDQYQTWRDLSIMSLCLVYLLNVVDAAVEGHFVNFDISENLSMNILPSFNPAASAIGVGVKFNIK